MLKHYKFDKNDNFRMPTIETCFNCFATRSSNVRENIKTTKPPTTIQNLHPPMGRGGSLQNVASV